MMNKKNQVGFSLTELMVGITIGLIGALVIGNTLGISAAQRNKTVNSIEAFTAGSVVEFNLARDLKSAGFNFSQDLFFNCTFNARNPTNGSNSSFPLVPVTVTPGAGNTLSNFSDTVRVLYGRSTNTSSPTTLKQSWATASSTSLEVDRVSGFNRGDFVLVAQGINGPCTMAEVSNFVIPAAGSNLFPTLNVDTGSYTDQFSNNQTATQNPPSNSFTYAPDSKVLNVGSRYLPPQFKEYSVQGATNVGGANIATDLIVTDLITNIDGLFAENIAGIKVFYGRDTSATPDGTIDIFDQTNPTTLDQWNRVLAIRYAIVAISAARDAEQVTAPTLNIIPADASIGQASYDITLTPAQRNYRYRVFSSIVPLRNNNIMWRNVAAP